MIRTSRSMGPDGRDSSCDGGKLVFLSSRKNKKKFSNHQENEPCLPKSSGSKRESIKFQIQNKGPVCRVRRKIAVVISDFVDDDEDGDFVKQFGSEGWTNEENSMWLSSGSASPSSCFDDCTFTSFLNLSVDEWLLSLILTSENSGLLWSKSITLFDGSRVNPMEEASLVLGRTSSDEETGLQEGLKAEEVVSWLVSSVGNESVDSSSSYHETLNSYSQSCEDTSTSDNFSRCSSQHHDYPSRIYDLDEPGFFCSFDDLDGQNNKWISDIGTGLNFFQSDFPSSSCSSSHQSCDSSVSSFTELQHLDSPLVLSSSADVSEALASEDSSRSEPIFWPSDPKPDWNSEVKWDFFIMSPRKVEYNDRGAPLCTSKSIPSSVIELKQAKSCKDFKKIKTMSSSSLRKSPIKSVNSRLHKGASLESSKAKEVCAKQSVEFFEEDVAPTEGIPIEMLLGLKEFDGHEGVESEFNIADFSVDKSPSI